jgi:hypothetical protein
MASLRLCSLLTLLITSGCAHSRWALSDRDYLAKYGSPAEEKAPWNRKLKQAWDARFLEGRTGGYAGAGAGLGVHGQSAIVGGEIGGFHYVSHSVESRMGLAGLASTSEQGGFTGGSLGVRVQTPSRLAPFVGLGGFAGYSEKEESATDDGVDNDQDMFVDESDETTTEINHFLAAVYPEVGVHFWFNPRFRLTASASYYMTTGGRNDDTVMLGLNLGFLPWNGPFAPQPPAAPEFTERALPKSAGLPPASEWMYAKETSAPSELTPILNEAMKAPPEATP